MTISKSDYTAQSSAAVHAGVEKTTKLLAIAKEAFESNNLPENSDELTKLAEDLKSAKKRNNENIGVANFIDNDKVMSLCYQLRVDFVGLMNDPSKNTRECKKRFKICANAIVLNSCEALNKAEFAFFKAVAVNSAGKVALKSVYTLEQCRVRALNHETITQARYMKDFLIFMRSATFEDESKTVTITENSVFYKKMLSLFA